MVVALIVGEITAFLGTMWSALSVILYIIFWVAGYKCSLFVVGKYKLIVTGITFFCLICGIYLMGKQIDLYEEFDLIQYDENISKKDIECTGYILSMEVLTYGCKVNIDTDKGIIVAYFSEIPDVKYGQKIVVAGIILPMEIGENFGNYDEKNVLQSKGIILKLKVDSFQLSDDESGYSKVKEGLRKIKDYLSDILSSMIDVEEYGVLSAMLLGDSSELDKNLKELYSINGISHIITISGLHISLIGMGLYKMLRIRMRYISSALISFGAMFLYLLLIGNPVSAVRAVIMHSIHLIGDVLGRKYDLITSVSIAAIFLLTDNPYYLFNASFQLSFMAIIAVCVVSPVITSFIKIKSKVVNGIIFNLIISITLMPISSYLFFRQATYGPFINLIVVPLMSLVLITSLLGIGAYIVFIPVDVFFIEGISLLMGRFLIGAAVYILRFYKWLGNLFMELPYASIVTGKPSVEAVFISYIIILLVIIILRNREKNFMLKTIVALSLVCTLVCVIYGEKKLGFFVYFLDVGQGDCAYVKSESGNDYLIDGGSSDESKVGQYKIESFLEAMQVDTLEYVFVSHCDTDHISGIIELIKRGQVDIKNLVLPMIYSEEILSYEMISLAKSKNINIIYMKAGDKLVDGRLTFNCISPKPLLNADADIDKNEKSMVLVAEYKDVNVIFTGDIGVDTEILLLDDVEKYCKKEEYTLLKVAHHGSKNSTCMEFLEKTKPDVAVISCGKDNSYGHPSKDTLDRLINVGSKIFGTVEYGGIEVRIGKEGVVVEGYMNMQK